MSGRGAPKTLMIIIAILALGYLAVGVAVDVKQRSFIYFPTHDESYTPLRPWIVAGEIVGYCRAVSNPRTIWLMTHGNAGQASHREYVLAHIAAADSLYVLEYPGYGQRGGRPSKDSINAAAADAYGILRSQFPATPIGVIGESIGSGPASFLASALPAPDKIVLVVPFDTFSSVASEHMPLLPVRAILKDKWDNISALRGYAGPIDIYGAVDDRVVPCEHAKRLAAAVHNAKFVLIEGGHNDWSNSDLVQISR
jgi:pimeloyl-ACP methyl ester carboxylesterase